MHRLVVALFALSTALCAGCVHYEGERLRQVVAVEHGRQVAQARCGSCHAIGAAGESPTPAAPQFRALSENYRGKGFETAIAQGISPSHPPMTDVQLTPRDVHDLTAYLQSIQATPHH